MSEPVVEQLPDVLKEAVRDYEDVHTGLGILGNVSFFVGSIFFLFEGLKTAGVWLFIIGSFGMMIGSIGQAIVRAERKRRDQQRDDERRRLGDLVRRIEGRPRRNADQGGPRAPRQSRPSRQARQTGQTSSG